MDRKSERRVPLAISVMIIAALVLGLHARYAFAQGQPQNPYSPAYGHPYRHGVVPTLEAWQEMQAWEAEYRSQAVTPATTTASNCPPPGVGDECSETDPLYATD